MRLSAPPEDAYIPFGWTEALRSCPAPGVTIAGKSSRPTRSRIISNADCGWIQLWVELPDASARERMQAFIDSYWAEQRKSGRFQRPRNNRLTDVKQWLLDQHVVENDDRILVGLAFAFLVVCLINTVGLLLAKFLNGAALTGVRRALGASRRQVFIQHMVETGVLAAAGALLGLILAAAGLWGLRVAIRRRGGIRLQRLPGPGALRRRQYRHSSGSRRHRRTRRRAVSRLARGAPAASRLSQEPVRENRNESQHTPHPLVTAAQSHRCRLVALQIALALAILVNATYIVKQRVDSINRPTGIDDANLFAIESSGFTSRYDYATSVRDDLDYLRGLSGVIAATPSERRTPERQRLGIDLVQGSGP